MIQHVFDSSAVGALACDSACFLYVATLYHVTVLRASNRVDKSECGNEYVHRIRTLISTFLVLSLFRIVGHALLDIIDYPMSWHYRVPSVWYVARIGCLDATFAVAILVSAVHSLRTRRDTSCADARIPRWEFCLGMAGAMLMLMTTLPDMPLSQGPFHWGCYVYPLEQGVANILPIIDGSTPENHGAHVLLYCIASLFYAMEAVYQLRRLIVAACAEAQYWTRP
jgi:hypothetical protein